jgi:hypothetical protein
MREVRRRTRVVALMLVGARLRYVAGTRWGSRRYLDMEHLIPKEDAALTALAGA